MQPACQIGRSGPPELTRLPGFSGDTDFARIVKLISAESNFRLLGSFGIGVYYNNVRKKKTGPRAYSRIHARECVI